MASADTAFTWTVSGGIGSVDEKGVFTAGSSMASGTLTCSYGNTRASIPVNVGMGDPQDASFVSTFEDGLGGFTASEGVSLSRVTDYTSVARGTGSLKALWDGESADGFTLSVSPADVADMNYLTLWARSENTHGTLTAVFTDAEGNELTAPLSAATVNGWKQLTAPVPEGAVQFTGLHFEKSSSGLSHSALLLDQIVLTAHHAVTNSDCPAVHLSLIHI